MTSNPVRVFVSYAHADQAVQATFQGQLRAAESQGAFAYWDDTRIEPGQEWDTTIREQIETADIALLLVSDSFLSSRYCTTVEVPRLLRDMRKIFWVTVNACPWELSPFHEIQACATLDGMDEVQIKSAAKRVVLLIAAHAKNVERQRSPASVFLAQCMPEHARQFTSFEELRGGRHCWVQRAMAALDDGDPEPVVLKVLLKNPFEDVAGPFAHATARAETLRHPSFIRLRAHYLDGRYPVLVMEGIGQPPLHDVLQRQGPFRPDAVRDLIATAGEAFAELHRADGVYGILTCHNVFVDAAQRSLRFSALSITGLLSQMRGWKEFLGVDPDAAAYLIPEQFANQPLSPYSDQYVLGQIAIEMLTGRQPPPTHIVSPSDLADKNAFFANPLCAITEPWIRYHQGLAEVLTRLLHADPQRRFPSMDEAVKQLWDVEDEVVAYARFAYKAACDQPGFFDAFYSAFFAACPGARDEFVRAHGEQHAERMATQAQVLKFALASTLASPSTLKKKLAQFSAKHQTVPPEYFTAFAETFVATLKAQFADLPQFVLDASRTVLTRAATHMAADGGTGVVDQRPLGAA